MQRAALLSLLTTLLLLPTVALADDYRDELIAQCPMYKAATGSYAPVYPALARQILDDYGITEGVCVDLGAGCGSLSMALAAESDLTVYALDIDPVAVRLCGVLADEAGLTGRVLPVEGDATDLLFRDAYADIVVSRGSIFFWDDQLAGVLEAYRILKPGGVAYIGGGFSRILDPEIRTPLAEARRDATANADDRDGWRPLDADIVERAREAGIGEIRLIEEPIVGWWLEIRKPPADEGTADDA